MTANRPQKINWFGVFFPRTWIVNFAVTFIVGTYLAIITFGTNLFLGWLRLFLGSIVAINVGGFLFGRLVYYAACADSQVRRLLKIPLDGTTDAR